MEYKGVGVKVQIKRLRRDVFASELLISTANCIRNLLIFGLFNGALIVLGSTFEYVLLEHVDGLEMLARNAMRCRLYLCRACLMPKSARLESEGNGRTFFGLALLATTKCTVDKTHETTDLSVGLRSLLVFLLLRLAKRVLELAHQPRQPLIVLITVLLSLLIVLVAVIVERTADGLHQIRDLIAARRCGLALLVLRAECIVERTHHPSEFILIPLALVVGALTLILVLVVIVVALALRVLLSGVLQEIHGERFVESRMRLGPSCTFDVRLVLWWGPKKRAITL